MNYQRIALTALFCGSIAATCFGQAKPSSTKADNTAVNTRDRKAGAVTADQQKMNASDRTLTQKIRKSLMADKGLSMYAHNIKIVTMNGMVTLKGPVKSEDEKTAVMAKAVEVTGASDKVTNQISVAK